MPRASPTPGDAYLPPKPDEDPEMRHFSAKILKGLTPADRISQKCCGWQGGSSHRDSSI